MDARLNYAKAAPGVSQAMLKLEDMYNIVV